MKKQTAIVQAQPSAFEYFKLTVVFIFLFCLATLMSTLSGFNMVEWIRWFMGGFLVIFAGLKLMGIEVFIKVFPLYDLIAQKFAAYKYMYPIIQVLLGILYLIGFFSTFRDILTIIIALSGLIGMLLIVSKKGAVRLSYLGTILKLRFSSVIILENSIMIVLPIIMLIAELAS